jgi:catechol 2,3-dioxygenase-like lactoylglutathione lyase family enzyme
MSEAGILTGSKLVAFVPTIDPARARAFYEGVLGLTLVEETPFALVFDAAGTMLRVNTVRELKPQPFTVLGWDVEAIVPVIERLTAAGISFLRFPGMNDTDPHGIWTAPSGARVAWFNDRDGNVLSLTQF